MDERSPGEFAATTDSPGAGARPSPNMLGARPLNPALVHPYTQVTAASGG